MALGMLQALMMQMLPKGVAPPVSPLPMQPIQLPPQVDDMLINEQVSQVMGRLGPLTPPNLGTVTGLPPQIDSSTFTPETEQRDLSTVTRPNEIGGFEEGRGISVEEIQRILDVKGGGLGREQLGLDAPLMQEGEDIWNRKEIEKFSGEGTLAILKKATLENIPIDKIVGREKTESSVPMTKRDIKNPIEVGYNKETGKYDLYSGNHRLLQAQLNGAKTIQAFVDAEAQPTQRQEGEIEVESKDLKRGIKGFQARIPDTGAIQFNKKGDSVHISRVAVDEKQRRKGIGSSLIKKAEEVARENGAIKMTTEVATPEAVMTFWKNGYRPTWFESWKDNKFSRFWEKEI